MLMSSNKEKFTLFKDLSSEEKMLSFLPDSVRMFLDMLFSGKDKNKNCYNWTVNCPAH